MTLFNDSRLPERFWKKVQIGPSGCWLWTAAVSDPDGYGRFWWPPKVCLSHRVAYELLVGPIPEGFETDHLCRVRACCNPEHLEPVTRSINQLRGAGPARQRAMHAAQTHCKREKHPYTPDNTRFDTRGCRHCRACDRDRQKGNP